MKIQRIEFHRQQKVYEWVLTNELVKEYDFDTAEEFKEAIIDENNERFDEAHIALHELSADQCWVWDQTEWQGGAEIEWLADEDIVENPKGTKLYEYVPSEEEEVNDEEDCVGI